MTLKILRLTDVWPDWPVNGIFTALSSIEGFTPPWGQDPVKSLDMQYHGNHSGRKLTSPLVDDLLDGSGTLTTDQKKQLAAVCVSIYGKNWAKLWSTLEFEYNPIENYDMTETGHDTVNGEDKGTSSRTINYGKKETHDFREETTDTGTTDTTKTATEDTTRTTEEDNTRTSTGDTTRTTTGEVKREHGEVISNQRQATQERDHAVYGFNSGDSPVPASHDTDTDNATNTDTHSGTDTDTSTGSETSHQEGTETGRQEGSDTAHRGSTETDKETVDRSMDKDTTGTLTHSGEDTEHGTTSQERTSDTNHTLTRRGNIGVTTSQQMITQERELWFWQFFDQVFVDLDKVLTSPIY